MMAGLHDFLAMGGYGAYVWPAYALTALILGGMLAASVRELRGCQRALRGWGVRVPQRKKDERGEERERGEGGHGSVNADETETP